MNVKSIYEKLWTVYKTTTNFTSSYGNGDYMKEEDGNWLNQRATILQKKIY